MSSEPLEIGELRRHLQHMTALHEVSTRIVAALDPDAVVAGVLDSLNDLLAYQTAAIYLQDLDVRRASKISQHANSAVVEAMQNKQTVRRERATGPLQLTVPLLAGGQALGALQLTLGGPLGIDDVKIVELLAATAAVALQNARLYQETQRLATMDPLTGLSNYRHFHDLLGLEVQRARRMGYSVGFLMMDLDHFKLINDQHGHPAGDRALRLVADQLRGHLRRTDVIGRLGGEEFAVILPGDSLQEVAIVAEKLRRAIEELPPFEGGSAGEEPTVTLSVGGASLSADVVDAQLLMSYADQALYEAKRQGRNRVHMWTDPG